ncbi:hypothetical protein SAMN04489806_2609 [Paramicrobacterium humi]|uniref:LysM domain-containing protein n=1 Tax=Paramicrobacterium humi TaxID=640635 RepID=A0A1H4PTU0_9MICO|nr:hypothetical protein [Microbacterium humi]SEC10592.1 hypothetical protein SAMN04489806_2609 [Microbacterium humi]
MSTAAKSSSVRVRLTRRGRAVVTALAALPLLVGVGVLSTNASSAFATSHAAEQSFEYVTVGAGESLWGLAQRVAPNADPRDVVADIVRLNQLESSSVGAGARVAIPARYADAE